MASDAFCIGAHIIGCGVLDSRDGQWGYSAMVMGGWWFGAAGHVRIGGGA